MDEDRINEYITLIFNKELAELRKKSKTWDMNFKVKNGEKRRVEYKNADTLIDVFANIRSDKLKEYFVEQVAYKIWAVDEEYYTTGFGYAKKFDFCVGSSALAFYTLIRLGYSDRAVEAAQNRINSCNCYLLFYLLWYVFQEDYNYFNISHINNLTKNFRALDDAEPFIKSIRDQILDLSSKNGFEILKKEIQGVNIEINRDKESVIRKISSLGLKSEYEDFLQSLDEYIATQSGLVASGMVSNFRSFWEQIIIDLANKIAKITKESVTKTEKTPIANARSFIKNKLDLADADNDLISKYVKILHSEGGHAFMSSVEYFRLARNIGIEILLLLLTKTESLLTR